MPAVRIVCRAGAFGGYHCGAERVLRRALDGEGGAVVRLFEALKNLAAEADRRFAGRDLSNLKNLFGVIVGEFR
jgi:hypothetical protein